VIIQVLRRHHQDLVCPTTPAEGHVVRLCFDALCGGMRRILNWVAVLGYLVVGIIRIRSYTQTTAGTSFAYTPVPDWGWICAFCVGMLWLWCAAWAGGVNRFITRKGGVIRRVGWWARPRDWEKGKGVGEW
jgi:hypothetical protein